MKLISLLCVLLWSSTGLADGVNNLHDRLLSCSKEKSDSARLACYDGLIDVATPLQQESLKDNFGQEHLAKSEQQLEEDAKPLIFNIKSIGKNAHKQLFITFENGQKWKQTDTRRLKLNAGDQVELQRGAFRAVYLNKVDANQRIKVKRIQ